MSLRPRIPRPPQHGVGYAAWAAKPRGTGAPASPRHRGVTCLTEPETAAWPLGSSSEKSSVPSCDTSQVISTLHVKLGIATHARTHTLIHSHTCTHMRTLRHAHTNVRTHAHMHARTRTPPAPFLGSPRGRAPCSDRSRTVHAPHAAAWPSTVRTRRHPHGNVTSVSGDRSVRPGAQLGGSGPPGAREALRATEHSRRLLCGYTPTQRGDGPGEVTACSGPLSPAVAPAAGTESRTAPRPVPHGEDAQGLARQDTGLTGTQLGPRSAGPATACRPRLPATRSLRSHATPPPRALSRRTSSERHRHGPQGRLSGIGVTGTNEGAGV